LVLPEAGNQHSQPLRVPDAGLGAVRHLDRTAQVIEMTGVVLTAFTTASGRSTTVRQLNVGAISVSGR
jgi:hypothetical protein